MSAHKSQSRKVDVVLNSEYDALSFGCSYLTKDIDMCEGYADVITLQSIHNHLEIDRFQIIDMCILMGIDCNKKISGVGPKMPLVEIQAHGKLVNTKYYNNEGINIERLHSFSIWHKAVMNH